MSPGELKNLLDFLSCAVQLVAGTNYAFEFEAFFDCTSQQRSGSFGSVTLDAIMFSPLPIKGQNLSPQVRNSEFLPQQNGSKTARNALSCCWLPSLCGWIHPWCHVPVLLQRACTSQSCSLHLVLHLIVLFTAIVC